MKKDTIYLLAPGFVGDKGREFCPECAEIWGLLHYYPAILSALDIVYEPLAHPREGLTGKLGAGEWNCPTLILAAKPEQSEVFTLQQVGDMYFIDNARDIAAYFSQRYGTPLPRG